MEDSLGSFVYLRNQIALVVQLSQDCVVQHKSFPRREAQPFFDGLRVPPKEGFPSPLRLDKAPYTNSMQFWDLGMQSGATTTQREELAC